MDSCVLSTGSPLLKSIVRYSVPLKDASEGALSGTKKTVVYKSANSLQ